MVNHKVSSESNVFDDPTRGVPTRPPAEAPEWLASLLHLVETPRFSTPYRRVLGGPVVKLSRALDALPKPWWMLAVGVSPSGEV